MERVVGLNHFKPNNFVCQLRNMTVLFYLCKPQGVETTYNMLKERGLIHPVPNGEVCFIKYIYMYILPSTCSVVMCPVHVHETHW